MVARIQQHQAERDAAERAVAAEKGRYFRADTPPPPPPPSTIENDDEEEDLSTTITTTHIEQKAELPSVPIERPPPPPLSIYLRKVDELDGRIRIRGNTREGVSCSVLVNDFHPYFIIAMPDSWTRAHIPVFAKQLQKTATRIKKECAESGKRAPAGLLPVPTCQYDTGTSAFTWLPHKLRGIKVVCPSIAAWRFYAELLTDGTEAAYQQELEDLFKKRDADEAAAKALKKAQTIAARQSKVDVSQPQVGTWSFNDEKSRYHAGNEYKKAEQEQEGDEEEEEDEEQEDETGGGGGGGNSSSAVGSVSHEAITDEVMAPDDQPATFNRNARKHQWNGVDMSCDDDDDKDGGGVPPYIEKDEEGNDVQTYTYKFEVYNNGWKMPVIFLTLAGLHTKAWVDVMAPTLIQDEAKRLTTTQIEVECSVNHLVYDPTRNEERDHSFQLSYDIECLHAKDSHTFPVATNLGDPANVTTVKIDQPGALVPQPPVRVAFCLGTAIPSLLPNIQYVLLFDDERKKLMALRDLFLSVDPDNFVTYNGISFDAVYLLDRGETLELEGFNEWSDVRGKACTIRQVIRQAKQFGELVY